ncbi:MAG: hypothetical protein JWN25_1996 [Verrucomicrobiales bacterium]|nr:hypothetical protein [Verrucomicrobiales bacterium]
MLRKLTIFIILGLTVHLNAQETVNLESLKKQLQEMQRVQDAQKAQIDQLTQQLQKLSASPSTSTPAPAKTAEQVKLEKELTVELAAASPEPETKSITSDSLKAKAWSPSDPIPVMRSGSAYMNISFDALIDTGWSTAPQPDMQLQLGDHDPQKRGFSLRNAEIALDGAVDPYFKGFANIVLKLDNDNQTTIELEEAYVQSTTLPLGLQLKAGQFFAAFGRQNAQHPHQWAFVDSPIISTRAFGPDGLRNVGTQLSWLAPLPFFTELTLGILDGQGGTTHSFRNRGDADVLGVQRFAGRTTFDRHLEGIQDLIFVPRISSSFDISDRQTIVVGVSGAFGSNDTGPHSRTEVYGADLYYKWKPENAMEGFPFVSWQTEGMYRRFGAGEDVTAGLGAENIRDYGVYSQILYGFKPRWVSGLRAEYASGNKASFDPNDPFRGERYRVSPVLTFFPSEFSKLRLQYNYDHGQYFEDAHSIWLQLEFLLGAHGAHKF